MRKWNFGRVLLIVAALIAVIGSVLYVLLDGTDKTFTWIGFGLALLGALSTVISFTQFQVAPFVPAVLYAAAFGFVLRVAIPSLSDVWNKVNFIGGNAVMGITFSCVYLVCALLAVWACFVGTDRKKNPSGEQSFSPIAASVKNNHRKR